MMLELIMSAIVATLATNVLFGRQSEPLQRSFYERFLIARIVTWLLVAVLIYAVWQFLAWQPL